MYREVPPDDYERCVRISNQAFGDPPDHTRRWLAGARPGDLRGWYEQGQLVTQLELYPLRIQTGRASMGCAGVSAVATPPEQRRRGYVGRTLQAACRELRERGIPLTLLGAFKQSFYGQYGWMTSMERRRYTGSPALYAPFRTGPVDAQPVGVAHISELDAVYQRALRGRFGPAIRTSDWWERFVLGDDYWQTSNEAYVIRDSAGQARAYTIYRLQTENGKRTLHCREMVALDPQARGQLFAFLSNYDSQIDELSFYAPTDAPVNLLFPDALECAAEPHFMGRVTDVAAALQGYGYPPDLTGQLSIAIHDTWLPELAGVYTLEVANGTAICEHQPAATAGLVCDIRVLMPILSRHISPRKAVAFGLLEAPDRAALDLAEALFAGPAPFISERF